MAVLLLDRPLFISSYPQIASNVADDGTTLSRIRRSNPSSLDATQFQSIESPVTAGLKMGFPLAYTVQAAGFEGETDTGGALIDLQSNTIYGVISEPRLADGHGLRGPRRVPARLDPLGRVVQPAPDADAVSPELEQRRQQQLGWEHQLRWKHQQRRR